MPGISFGILTISDTCYTNFKMDRSGPALAHLISNRQCENGKFLNGEVVQVSVVPDSETIIMEKLVRWCDEEALNVILTTGGTGFSSSDVTPEATKKVIEKEAPGISQAMLVRSLNVTPMAMLSRGVCGIRGKTLIINLPGSPKAATECFSAIAIVIPHAVDLILDKTFNVKATHSEIQSPPEHCCPHKRSDLSLDMDNVAGRLRESPFPMISIDEAMNIMKKNVEKYKSHEDVNIWKVLDRILFSSVYSPYSLPPFRASIKDGYAVIAADGKGRRAVLGGLEAGQCPGILKLERGTCIRINTGAPVPDEATAVVQVEDTQLIEASKDGKEEKEIEILVEPKENQDIRPVGSDIKAGNIVLEAGRKIGAIEMGILAACGFSSVPVTKVPIIGVFSTGNELQNPGEPPKPGHIFDSNKITIMMMLKEQGYDSLDLGIITDRADVMIEEINKAFEQVDVLITTGSVSMGDRDLLKPILQNVFNGTIHFGRVNVKPGKPTTFVTCEYQGKTKYVLCLPGNPVSTVVTAHLFMFPLLNLLITGQHYSQSAPVIVTAKTTVSYTLDPRPEYARVMLEWRDNEPYPFAHTTGNQISSKLLSCSQANALLMLPEKTSSIQVLSPDTLVPAMLLGFHQSIKS